MQRLFCSSKLRYLPLALVTFAPLSMASMPAATVTAMGGPYFSAWGDALFPITNKNNQLTYVDFQAEGSDTESGILSVGLGYRQQATNAGIYGINLFYDRARSSNSEYYNLLGPGVEYLTPSWRYRLNGYIPFGDKDKLHAQGWADEMGNFSYVKFEGHNEYDKLAYAYESLGNGADATVAYRFQNDLRWEVEMSPYAFERKENNTLFGMNLRLNYFEADNVTLFLGDGYDNANHNRVYVGVTFNFGARNNDNTFANLLLAPVVRNQNVNTTSNGLPVSEFTEYSEGSYLEEDNVYFVNNSDDTGNQSGEEDGTYEHQYSSLEDVNDIEGDADIRVESTGNSYSSTTTIDLDDGQELSGYESNFRKRASGNNMPVLYAPGYSVTGAVSINHVTLLNNGDASNTAITVNDGGILCLNDSIVGSMDPSTSYQTDVLVGDQGMVLVNHSTLNAYLGENGDLDDIAIGIMGEGSSNIYVTNSVINALSESNNTFAAGVFDQGDSVIDIEGSTITATTHGSSSKAYGVIGADSSVVIDDSVISAVSTDTGNGTSSTGVEAYNSSVSISNSTINANSGKYADGVVAEGSTLTMSDTTVNSSSTGSANGLILYQSEGAVTDSTFNVDATGETGWGYAWGIGAVGGSTLTESGNTFNVTGPSPSDIWPSS